MASHDSHTSLLSADIGQRNLFRLHLDRIVAEVKNPSHLLPDLHFAPNIMLAIIEKERNCARDAAAMMCEELLKSTDPNWFGNFKQALKNCSHGKLYKLLNMDDVKDEENYELLLQHSYRQLIDVKPADITPYLYSKGLISKIDLEELEAAERNRSPTCAMQMLLCILPKNENWFYGLLNALKEACYNEVVKAIRPELLSADSRDDVSMLVADTVRKYKTEQAVPKKTAVVPPTPQRATSRHDDSTDTPLKSGYDRAEQSATERKSVVNVTPSGSAAAIPAQPSQGPVADSSQFTLPHAYADIPRTTRGDSRTPGSQPPDLETAAKRLEIARDPICLEEDISLDLRSTDHGPVVPTEQQNTLAFSEQTDSYDFNRRSEPTTMTDGPSDSVSTPAGATAEESTRLEAPRESPKDVPREPLELRGYQQELAADALRGVNCLIVAPTGCGKTHVALAVAKHVYDGATLADDPKIAFIVPTVALVSQQLNQFSKYMTASCRCIGLSGEEEFKLSLKHLIDVNDVLIMTPQILLNALNSNALESLSVFSLLIFDECHRMTKNHPYNEIMSKYYVDLLLKEESGATAVRLPQVIGLTASPGVGQANTTDKAVEHILQLCANMSAMKISTVRDPINVAELARYENKPTEDTEEVQGRQYDPFADLLQNAMSQIENCIQKRAKETPNLVDDIPNIYQLVVAPAQRGADPYVQFVSKLKKHIAIVHDQTVRKCFVACLRHLEVYNNALVINADCRTKDALSFIEQEFEQFQRHRGSLAYDEIDRWLDKLHTDMLGGLIESSRDPRSENPKLKKLQEIITNYHRENKNSQGIIFCKTRDLTVAMVNWIKETTELAWLNPHHLFGANKQSQSSATAMTHNKLEDVLTYFKGGQHKIIVATSVAEEGLDVTSCNYVIRYEHVTNDIARIQARGRARAGDAQYLLVAEQGRRTVARDEANKVRETMMNEAIKEIDAMQRGQIEERIRELQVKSKEARGKLRGDQLKKAGSHEGDYELRCMQCDALCTWSSDLRTIKKVHHVTIDEDFASRVELRPHPQPKKYDNWEKKAKIDCAKCHYDWGIKAVYCNVPYHVLKVESFVLISPHGERSHCKKWKGIPFSVQELSLEDTQQMSQRALADSFMH